MKISSATVDFWLYVNGHGSPSTASNPYPNPYSDYQHQHWEILSSGTIDNTLNNKPAYTWTLNGRGFDDFGSWSAINQSLTSTAQVWINSSGMVVLEQTKSSNNVLTETGTPHTQSHTVSEVTWPTLTWSPTANTSSPITHSDGTLPSYHIVTVQTGGKKSLRRLAYDPGVGGRDYTGPGIVQFFQKPAVVGATAWWAWTINLAP